MRSDTVIVQSDQIKYFISLLGSCFFILPSGSYDSCRDRMIVGFTSTFAISVYHGSITSNFVGSNPNHG